MWAFILAGLKFQTARRIVPTFLVKDQISVSVCMGEVSIIFKNELAYNGHTYCKVNKT